MKKKTHGTRYSYNTGCRCRECRNANNTYLAKYQRERIKSTPQYNQRKFHPWEPWEDELAADYTKTAWQIAEILKRTHAAVTNRRRNLLARQKTQASDQH